MKETTLTGESKDILNENIETLKELFPEIVSEDKIDFDKFKTIFGGEIDDSSERYSFTWPGKTQAIKESQKQSTGTLRPCKQESKNWDTTKNLYIEGDNLEVLKLLQKGYYNKIKAIYIDPPYDYTENDGFTKYQKEGFTLEDLLELKEECDKALDSEAFVIISNNDTKAVREAFKNDSKHNYSFYYIEKLDTKRLINCKGNLRNTGKEILIVGIPCSFPQVKAVTKLLEYVRIKNEKDLKNEDYLLNRFGVTKLRVTQVLSTLQYFDVVDNNFGFTIKGKELRKCSKKTLNREMKNVILEKPIFKEVYDSDSIDTSNKMDNSQIAEIIKRNSVNIKDGIAAKRAKFVREIVDWCLAN